MQRADDVERLGASRRRRMPASTDVLLRSSDDTRQQVSGEELMDDALRASAALLGQQVGLMVAAREAASVNASIAGPPPRSRSDSLNASMRDDGAAQRLWQSNRDSSQVSDHVRGQTYAAEVAADNHGASTYNRSSPRPLSLSAFAPSPIARQGGRDDTDAAISRRHYVNLTTDDEPQLPTRRTRRLGDDAPRDRRQAPRASHDEDGGRASAVADDGQSDVAVADATSAGATSGVRGAEGVSQWDTGSRSVASHAGEAPVGATSASIATQQQQQQQLSRAASPLRGAGAARRTRNQDESDAGARAVSEVASTTAGDLDDSQCSLGSALRAARAESARLRSALQQVEAEAEERLQVQAVRREADRDALRSAQLQLDAVSRQLATESRRAAAAEAAAAKFESELQVSRDDAASSARVAAADVVRWRSLAEQFQQNHERAHEQLLVARGESSTAAATVRQLELQVEQLTRDLQDADEAADRLAQERDEAVASQRTTIEQLELEYDAELQRVRGDLESVTSKLQGVERNLESVRAERDGLSQRVQDSESRVAAATGAADAAAISIRELEATAQQLRADLAAASAATAASEVRGCAVLLDAAIDCWCVARCWCCHGGDGAGMPAVIASEIGRYNAALTLVPSPCRNRWRRPCAMPRRRVPPPRPMRLLQRLARPASCARRRPDLRLRLRRTPPTLPSLVKCRRT